MISSPSNLLRRELQLKLMCFLGSICEQKCIEETIQFFQRMLFLMESVRDQVTKTIACMR